MMRDTKTVILLATYNGERFLSEQLHSLLTQTCQEFTLLVSDDGSTDSTPLLLHAYQKQYPDRIRILEEHPRFGNARDHFLYLLSHCNAAYILFCDQDDVWRPDKLARTRERMKALEKQTGGGVPLLVHTDLCVTNEKLEILSPSFMAYSRINGGVHTLNRLLVQNVVTGCTVMINAPLRALAVRACARERILMHDWWLALIAAAFGRIAFVEKPTILYRQHVCNAVGAKNARSLHYRLQKIRDAKAIRHSLEETSTQAMEFYRTFSDMLPQREERLVKGYAGLFQHGKPYRIRFLLTHGCWKNGVTRKIGQCIWG